MSSAGRSIRTVATAAAGAALVAAVSALGTGIGTGLPPRSASDLEPVAAQTAATKTPVEHLVVIFQENVSFDHYFATYPRAANPPGEPAFQAAPGAPAVNGLNASLLAPNNPNSAQPFRLDRTQAQTCDQDHSYTDEQKATDSGLMDKFVETIGRGGTSCADYGHGKGLTMGYYDGNTVTAMWNYAQHFAMSDNSYNTTYGPSSPGAINLVSGQTHWFTNDKSAAVTENETMIGDPQPGLDKCSSRDTSVATPENKGNVGDLLNARNVSWGWFQGGFADCNASHTDVGGVTSKDYIPHHEPFQYYQSTANPQHLPPSSVAMIGKKDQANHQYDLADFWKSVDAGSMPAVSFLKAAAYQDGHAGYSTPLDEQTFLVNTINRLQRSKDWANTAVVIAYDDSDGWYDHQMGPIVNQSLDAAHDGITKDNLCGSDARNVSGGYQDRCGYGPRLPLLVISPYARSNYVDHTTTDQTSILAFIEDNWNLGRIGDHSFDEKAGSLDGLFDFASHRGRTEPLFLDPATGAPHRG
ncbi:phospholipase C [Actinopolymorpha singaporensis]